MTQRNQRIAQGAMIAALYVVLALVFKAVNVIGVEIRLAEMLTVLPAFFPVATPALFIGCFIANIFSGNFFDVVFGSLATLIGCIGTRHLRKKGILMYLPPIISNTVVIPLVLKYGYGLETGYSAMVFIVFVSETLSVFIFGGLLKKILTKILKRG